MQNIRSILVSKKSSLENLSSLFCTLKLQRKPRHTISEPLVEILSNLHLSFVEEEACKSLNVLQEIPPTLSPMRIQTRNFHSASGRSKGFPLNSAPRRTFFRFGRDLNVLESEAEKHPQDPRKQARLYRAMVDTEPGNVIKRFESEAYARDQECAMIYLAALYETNQLDRAARQFLQHDDVAKGGARAGDGGSPLSLINFGTKDKPIYIHNAKDGSGWKRLGTLFNIIIIGTIIYSITSMGDQRLGGITSKVHKLFKKDTAGQIYTFDDIQGCDEAKAELEEIVDFLKNPEKFNKLGAKMPKGILLVGPPGTGKTLLAKAVAGEANVPFIYASGSQFDEVFVGVGSMRIRQMFESAKEQAPAIIFIDEIDAIGSKRNPRDPQHSRMSLNQLLTELDGFAESAGVVVIAATNLPDSLDKALLRPGRFDRHVNVPLPDRAGRRSIINMYLKDIKIDHDVDIDVLARSTPGFSGAELAKMVNQAKILASLQNGNRVTMHHLEQSKDEMILGSERKSTIIAEEDRNITAYHEGGHAIVALNSPFAHPIHKATIIPRGQALGMVSQLPDKDEISISKAQLLARMDVAMGGRAAEFLIFGENLVTTGASSDFNQANAIARAMVTQYGMSERLGPLIVNPEDWETLSTECRQTINSEIKRLLDESQDRARNILVNNKTRLNRLAKALLEYETLNRVEIEAIVDGRPIPSSSKCGLRDEKTKKDQPSILKPTPAIDLLF